jgi:hypothetical protein
MYEKRRNMKICINVLNNYIFWYQNILIIFIVMQNRDREREFSGLTQVVSALTQRGRERRGDGVAEFVAVGVRGPAAVGVGVALALTCETQVALTLACEAAVPFTLACGERQEGSGK